MSAATTGLANLGATVSAANATAATPTLSALAAGADEVSAAVALLFAGHGQAYQALSAQAASFHQQFARSMNAAAGQYLSAEAGNAQQTLLNEINAPTEALFGRALIGDGVDGTMANPHGGTGGILYGNGGNGFPKRPTGWRAVTAGRPA